MNNEKIGFANFKAFGPHIQSFELKPLTLIYGPNSVGKSSLLQMLMYRNYLERTGNTDLVRTNMFGDPLELGGFKNVMHKHKVDDGIVFEYEYEDCNTVLKAFFEKASSYDAGKFEEYLSTKKTLKINKKLFYDISIEELGVEPNNGIGHRVLMNKVVYTFYIDNEPFITQLSMEGWDEFSVHHHPILQLMSLPEVKASYADYDSKLNTENNLEWCRYFNLIETDDKPRLAFPLATHLYHLTFELLEFCKQNSRNLQYIGPLRFYPERGEISDTKQIDYEFKDSSRVWSSENMWKLLIDTDEQQISTLNEILEKLNMAYKLRVKKFYGLDDIYEAINAESFSKDDFVKLLNHANKKSELVFHDLKRGIDITQRDLGLGISQVLPILISAANLDWTDILIEQPELHLHPKVQCDLADVFIESIKRDALIPVIDEDEDIDFDSIKFGHIGSSNGIQKSENRFIIETHSEHLLLRIMKRMRHTAENKEDRDKSLDLTPDDVCLLYVDNNGKTTYIKELELDHDGTLLDPWPNGFFEEGHNERFE